MISYNLINQWWKKIDKINLFIALFCYSLGTIIVISLNATSHTRFSSIYFVYHHIIAVLISILAMIIISFSNEVLIRRFSIFSFICIIILMLFIPVIGIKIKGARRWISVGGTSLQPSEFLKTFFPIVNAWILASFKKEYFLSGFIFSFFIYAISISLLLIQPDIGTSIIITLIWASQLFVMGISFFLMIIIFISALIIAILLYVSFEHVKFRVLSFLFPIDKFDNYQVIKSMEAIKNGGFFGRGLGEGVIKEQLPDGHTDFIFAVIGEELGSIFCIMIILIFTILILRILSASIKTTGNFKSIALVGIATQVGLQSFFNISAGIRLLPAKGLTLPMISYGGSSSLSFGLLMGIILVFTKKKFGGEILNVKP